LGYGCCGMVVVVWLLLYGCWGMVVVVWLYIKVQCGLDGW
jgi:hypothetical protein